MHTNKTNPQFSGEIHKLNAAELLQRDPIQLDPANIQKEILNSTVMITGAAGSIGSELALQICSYKPFKIILIDQAETPLNDLDLRLRKEFEHIIIQSYPANITDALRMEMIFSDSKPAIVIHTAAYKHVPFMEKHPYEAIYTNVFGAKILADLAISYQVRKFVFVSTDKAVKPASVMGATKRIAENYLQYLSHEPASSTHFISTRFGNVLGSNGSVVLTFKKQIEEGGPITITHPDVCRYMMTVSEACQLVLEAGATGRNGAIHFFDMGQPIKILDLAKRMIVLAGNCPEDIGIEYIGLRPGEKLCEQLFDFQEAPHTTHPKIRIGSNINSALCMKKVLKQLEEALKTGDNEVMRLALKRAVPEYSG